RRCALSDKRIPWQWAGVTVIVLWAACLSPSFLVAGWPELGDQLPADQLRRQAEQFQEEGNWNKAAVAWEQFIARERTAADARPRYHYCQRRAQQIRRHGDASYRRQVQKLTLPAALHISQEILTQLKVAYVDHDKVDSVA